MFKMKMFLMTIITAGSSLAQAMDFETQRHFQFQEKKFVVDPASCGLTHFAVSVVSELTKVFPWSQGPVLMADADSEMLATVTTNKSSCLRDFAVVQYVKGCTYDVFKKPNRQFFETSYNLSRKHRGQSKYFVHPDWQVDSEVRDPVYQSAENLFSPNLGGRIAKYGVPSSPLKRTSEPQDILQDHESVFSNLKAQLYQLSGPFDEKTMLVTDRPTSASYINYEEESFQIAHNRVLHFKTCIYRLKDIPTQGDPAGMDVSADKGGPIACLDWSHNWVYNFKLNQFQPAWPNATPNLCRETPKVFHQNSK
jgi:hypothetical protein